MFRVAIIGAGISGLAAAHRLMESKSGKDAPLELTVFESSSRVGGTISTIDCGDHILEEGPDSFVANKQSGLELCKKLGLEDSLIETNRIGRRSMIALDGKLHPLPDGFVMLAPSRMLPLLTSPIFSMKGKARILLEPLIPPRPENGEDESVANFIERRFGAELMSKVAQAMIGGIYVGDITKLSAHATISDFVKMEQEFGSVIRGLLSRNKEKKVESEFSGKSTSTGNVSGARYSNFVSLEKGIGLLSDNLAKAIGAENFKLQSRICSIKPAIHKETRKWTLQAEFPESREGSTRLENDFDVVISTIPSYSLAPLVDDFAPALASELRSIRFASSAVAILQYKDIEKQGDAKSLDSFGFVVPPGEKSNLLAVSFLSRKYRGRSPKGSSTIRAFVGGVLGASILQESDEQLLQYITDDLRRYLSIESQPHFSKLKRWDRSMPQYEVGHLHRLKRIDSSCDKLGSLFLAGNSYRGVGIPDCISSGINAAEKALRYLGIE